MPRSTDVGAEALALPFQVACKPEIVEPGLADRQNSRVVGQTHQLVNRGLRRILVVGVDPHRGPQLGVALGQRDDAWQIRQIDRYAHGPLDAVVGHARKDAVEVGSEVGEIKVAVGIDQFHCQGSVALQPIKRGGSVEMPRCGIPGGYRRGSRAR